MTQELFVAEVTRTTRLTPGMVRVTFGGPDLAAFTTTGVGDEFVRVRFPGATGELRLPTLDAAGIWHEPENDDSHIEPYTIRHHDRERGEVDIDFVVHGHGKAGAWASAAQPGDRVAFTAPRGLYQPPAGATTQLFVTDATGIPALARLAEQLSDGVHAVAAVEVADESHRLDIGGERMQVEWIIGRGNGVGPSAITEALRAMPISAECYVWVSGEAGALRDARRYLRHERGLTPDRYDVIGYWRDKQEEWLEQYEALDEATLASLAAIWESSDDLEQNRDRYDRQLAELGL